MNGIAVLRVIRARGAPFRRGRARIDVAADTAANNFITDSVPQLCAHGLSDVASLEGAIVKSIVRCFLSLAQCCTVLGCAHH